MKKLLTIMSVALLVGCFSIRQPTLVGHAPMPTRGICAHRGASDTHPENTIAAFREAIRLGAQMIEFDVALSKDGELVLMHDRTIDRTTNGSGRPEDWLLADLKKLDAGSWKNSRFEGERIPTLGEALDVMPGNIWLNVHLKGGVELAKKTAHLIASKNRLHQAFLACGADSASAAKVVESRIIICNMERQANTLQYVDQTIESGFEFIQLLGGGKVDPAHTERLRQHGIRINYCCTNDPAILVRLFEDGVEFPLVDRVGEMLESADKLGIPRLERANR
ncbi:MAG: glycerophosphodiester phosphodiesterase family protein [Verrucomicrobiota bacterium]|jgi:glycerophosphoryl diester phosphodiesterase|nr:glycerophosphodiester phosphodiesterase family protein [Verrucomicrobiota bacterium]HJN82699.1 glycerophosphodiester phosphodiesterase family protein [Verrucomicrobiota bacterium]|tara:strand:- start:2 stop:838 length:837 start_codon:yes stop_codon:yes gene_type:complete